MSTLPLGLIPQSNSRAGVDNRGFLYDEAVLVKAGDIAAGIGKLDLIDFVGVKPDLSLTTFEH